MIKKALLSFFLTKKVASLEGFFRRMLVVLVIFAGWPGSVVQAIWDFPSAGSDGFSSKGRFSISFHPYYGGGSVSGFLEGPTCVIRSDSHGQDIDPSGNLGELDEGEFNDKSKPFCVDQLGLPPSAAIAAATSDAEIWPFPLDFNSGGGIDEVHTEIVGMKLSKPLPNGAEISLQAGIPLLSGVDCRLQSVLNLKKRSLGEVEARAGAGFWADGFFNLFLTMSVPDRKAFNVSPLTVRSNGLREFPPYRSIYMHGFNLLGRVILYDCETGCPAASIQQASHQVGGNFSGPGLPRARASLLPIVFSVAENAEGLLDPWDCHPFPQDVFNFGHKIKDGRTEGELFQALKVANANLNLRHGLGLVPEDNIISLSFGEDYGQILLFSVDPEAQGAANTAVAFNSSLSPEQAIPLAGIDSETRIPSNGGGDPGNEAAGDIYVSELLSEEFGRKPLEPIIKCSDDNAKDFVVPAKTGKNVIGFDESSLGLQAPAIKFSINNSPEDNEDDLDALEASSGSDVDSNEDGVIDIDRFVFFTLSANSLSLGDEFKPNDILVATAPEQPDEFTFDIYADGIDDIGLLEGDVIDALVLWDNKPYGILDELDEALFSLAAGSPSLNAGMNPNMPGNGPFSPGDVFRIKFHSEREILLYAKASELGLQQEDELNALDIAPPPPPPPPPCAVTLIDDSFTATTNNGSVNLAWETASEDDNAGFIVWRGQLKADKSECSLNIEDYTEVKQLNSELVPAQGGGSLYSYQDGEALPGNSYCYVLEDVELDGKRYDDGSHLSNPISVSVP